MTKDFPIEELQKTLSETLFDLEAVPYQQAEPEEFETIVFDGREKDNTKWKALITEHIRTAKTFEIHCWKEETDEIALALQYGSVKQKNWKYGTIIEGNVTSEFRDMLLNLPKPSDTPDAYRMMTPFFGIMFDNGFSSEHYGTENHFKLKQRDDKI